MMTVESAIESSRTDNRTVAIDLYSMDDVYSVDDYLDSVEVEPGMWDVWGVDWRLTVRIVAHPLAKSAATIHADGCAPEVAASGIQGWLTENGFGALTYARETERGCWDLWADGEPVEGVYARIAE